MQIHSNYSLKAHNTFGIEAKAEKFVAIKQLADLREALALSIKPVYLLGGGSNLLLTQNLKGLVIKNEIKGKAIVRRFKKSVYVEVGAGENWHEFVMWCIEKDLGGVENLSLIPGTVGAAPIQNIGAYGVELMDCFHALEALNLETGKLQRFRKKDCQFAYRESIFKKDLKGKYCITKVWLKLSIGMHKIRTKYGAILKELEQQNIVKPNIRDVSEAVIQIRSTKLPDPAKLGNSGSFFKNPVIPQQQFTALQKRFPAIIFYQLSDQQVKIPAGWLIEQCGWKGKKVGQTGAHRNQALVLVNYGKATGQEVLQLAKDIQQSVLEKFGVQLNREVNAW